MLKPLADAATNSSVMNFVRSISRPEAKRLSAICLLALAR
jgi:hypothetical protein